MLRIDRLLTLHCFSPLSKLRTAEKLTIPILMYHSISDMDEQGVHPYYRTCTSPKRFAQQMSWLHDHGYAAISLSEAVDLLSGTGTAPGKPKDEKYFVITFDDGFNDFYTDAFPILVRHGFMATVFLPTAFINTVNKTIMGKAFLSWSQVRELIKAGITFGSHSVSHDLLVKMTQAKVEQELRHSKETIEERVGSPVKAFSYPFAFPEHNKVFVNLFRNALQTCGYSCAVTTIIGTALPGDDVFTLKRIPVNTDDDPALYEAKLAGGYDWMHDVQYAVKSVYGRLGLRGIRKFGKWTSQ